MTELLQVSCRSHHDIGVCTATEIIPTIEMTPKKSATENPPPK